MLRLSRILYLIIFLSIALSSKAAVYRIDVLWDNGQTIQVAFLNYHDNKYKKAIEDIARIYENYANIKFEFSESAFAHMESGTGGYAHIWIDHDQSKFPSSYVGRRFLSKKSSSSTMNLPLTNQFSRIKSFDDSDRSYRNFKRIVLHEFGHALGLKHEHQNPNAEICWNENEMEKYCLENGINCRNYLPFENIASYRYSIYDRNSVMHYQINSEPTFCDYKSPFTYDLSTLDKRWINIMYPFPGETSPEDDLVLAFDEISIEVLSFDDEWSLSEDIEICGEISLLTRSFIGEECYSDLSNCYAETHRNGDRLLYIPENESKEFNEGNYFYKLTDLGQFVFKPNDEYFLHIKLIEKDVITKNDIFRATEKALEHEGDILVPIENLFWQKQWTCNYLLHEYLRFEPQLRVSLRLSLVSDNIKE